MLPVVKVNKKQPFGRFQIQLEFLRLRAASDLRLRFTDGFRRIRVCVFLEEYQL